MARKRKKPIMIFDGTRDVTEKDVARQKYYELLADQEAWNLTKHSKVSLLVKLINKIL